MKKYLLTAGYKEWPFSNSPQIFSTKEDAQKALVHCYRLMLKEHNVPCSFEVEDYCSDNNALHVNACCNPEHGYADFENEYADYFEIHWDIWKIDLNSNKIQSLEE